jgi:hypothetical protein
MKKQHPFDRILTTRFGGLLRHGSHAEDGQACLLEAATVARKQKWSDSPDTAGLPDLRSLNDGPWSSDEARTVAMRPVAIALWDWPEWDEAKRKALTDAVTLRLIREVLPDIFVAIGQAEHAEKMRAAPDLARAAEAAEAADWAAEAAGAARAARAAAEAAEAAGAARAAEAAAGAARAAEAAAGAARAAAGAARAADCVLAQCCLIWKVEAERLE